VDEIVEEEAPSPVDEKVQSFEAEG
jgi:hypothetical protein